MPKNQSLLNLKNPRNQVIHYLDIFNDLVSRELIRRHPNQYGLFLTYPKKLSLQLTMQSLPAIPNESILFQNKEVCIVAPNTPGSVLVVHHFDENILDVILSDGVKSRGQLVAEGVLSSLLINLADYNENIYFRTYPYLITLDCEAFYEEYLNSCSAWIAISVDPRRTYAYNSSARIISNGWEYECSKILLSDLINEKNSHSSEVLVKLPVIKPNWFAMNSKAFVSFCKNSRIDCASSKKSLNVVRSLNNNELNPDASTDKTVSQFFDEVSFQSNIIQTYIKIDPLLLELNYSLRKDDQVSCLLQLMQFYLTVNSSKIQNPGQLALASATANTITPIRLLPNRLSFLQQYQYKTQTDEVQSTSSTSALAIAKK